MKRCRKRYIKIWLTLFFQAINAYKKYYIYAKNIIGYSNIFVLIYLIDIIKKYFKNIIYVIRNISSLICIQAINILLEEFILKIQNKYKN